MKMQLNEAVDLSVKFLQKLELSEVESKYITENLIEAELAGRKTHGFIRLLSFKKTFDSQKLITQDLPLKIISETSNSLHIDGQYKLGYSPIYQSLEMAIPKAKQSKLFSVGIKDLGVTGYIGAYAKKSTEQDLIFIGFNNSAGGLVPYGSISAMWGTNPITVGIPTNSYPVILDMASSQITWGDLLVANNSGKQIKEGTAIDGEGNITTDPAKAMEGGLLPFFGHKGSGLAFIVELLGGALTGSRVGNNVAGGWGSFYILIDPTLFRPLKDFKDNIQTAIDELKNSPKMAGFDEIYFPGEQSAKLSDEQRKSNTVEIDDGLLEKIKNI